ncbi:tRNA (N6-threonylcarbamoyladenosine(37)-N6)-methyltransferase TrmO [Methanobrevibacter sp. OttesenSCG-928-I08]|nr:tRNA (N6-threonylcarbamoyladenosine(37)-N6)-methyltransferase TrmO [Methanobrevibacter sp. OttesenSCG-928-I08]
MIINLSEIGRIYSPFKKIEGMPVQPIGAEEVKGEIHVSKEYEKGLKDIDGFSHLTLIYYLHKCEGHNLEVTPFLDNSAHGVFATRSPKRPNNLGISVVQLDKVEGNILHISNVDVLDGTPVIDIKPYVPQLYEKTVKNLKVGWFENKHGDAVNKKADKRFL